MTGSDYISYFSEETDFSLSHPEYTSQWVHKTIIEENLDQGEVSIIFCSDDYLLKVNQEHLQHDYYTDIITFQYSSNPVSGDLFISIDRIRENANDYGVSFDTELHRVIIHGILHIIGYKDKTIADVNLIRSKEDYYLSKLSLS